MYKVLIVDDEEPAREKLQRFLKEAPIRCQVQTCRNAAEAMQYIQQGEIDLMFLDIQMPGMTGLEMVEEIGPKNCPPIVFVTAYDEYALQAFKIHALDYLLKPYDFERFNEALSHILQLINARKYPLDSLQSFMQELKHPRSSFKTQLWVQKGKKTIPLSVNDIEYLEADGNYVQICSETDHYLIRKSLSELEADLDNSQFVRIHRSHIINLQRIQEMYPKSHGDLFVIMRSGAKLVLSRRYKDKVLA